MVTTAAPSASAVKVYSDWKEQRPTFCIPAKQGAILTALLMVLGWSAALFVFVMNEDNVRKGDGVASSDQGALYPLFWPGLGLPLSTAGLGLLYTLYLQASFPNQYYTPDLAWAGAVGVLGGLICIVLDLGFVDVIGGDQWLPRVPSPFFNIAVGLFLVRFVLKRAKDIAPPALVIYAAAMMTALEAVSQLSFYIPDWACLVDSSWATLGDRLGPAATLVNLFLVNTAAMDIASKNWHGPPSQQTDFLTTYAQPAVGAVAEGLLFAIFRFALKNGSVINGKSCGTPGNFASNLFGYILGPMFIAAALFLNRGRARSFYVWTSKYAQIASTTVKRRPSASAPGTGRTTSSAILAGAAGGSRRRGSGAREARKGSGRTDLPANPEVPESPAMDVVLIQDPLDEGKSVSTFAQSDVSSVMTRVRRDDMSEGHTEPMGAEMLQDTFMSNYGDTPGYDAKLAAMIASGEVAGPDGGGGGGGGGKGKKKRSGSKAGKGGDDGPVRYGHDNASTAAAGATAPVSGPRRPSRGSGGKTGSPRRHRRKSSGASGSGSGRKKSHRKGSKARKQSVGSPPGLPEPEAPPQEDPELL